jgi:hypothetical protein
MRSWSGEGLSVRSSSWPGDGDVDVVKIGTPGGWAIC